MEWKYVCKRRLALERELGRDAFECEQVIELIYEAGLRKNVGGFEKCYEKLTKEFLVNIPEGCDNPLRKYFIKFFVRGRCGEFSLEVINKFLGINDEDHTEVKLTDDQICKVITAQQVKK